MELYRIRMEGEDGPERLGRAAAALGGLGVGIVDARRFGLDGPHPVDELLVRLALPLDLPAIDYVLAGAGCAVVELRRVDRREDLPRARRFRPRRAGGRASSGRPSGSCR